MSQFHSKSSKDQCTSRIAEVLKFCLFAFVYSNSLHMRAIILSSFLSSLIFSQHAAWIQKFFRDKENKGKVEIEVTREITKKLPIAVIFRLRKRARNLLVTNYKTIFLE